jgi:histidinol dehydrogenase
MKIILNPPRDQWEDLLKRPSQRDEDLESQVADLIATMKTRGWDAVADLTRRFDGYNPDPVRVTVEELRAAGGLVSDSLKQAIALASANIRKFHEAQRRTEQPVAVMEGIRCSRQWVPVDRVGLYIPGGTAPLISTVLMLAIPAQIAGCREIVLCTPANRDGKIDPAILYAAGFCGIDQVFRLGGAQAIASMAYGLGPVPKVDKIFGPGNSYVTIAKQLVSLDGVAIDMPAGPSELAVIADDSCDPAYIAADLLSQAEHGPDSQVVLITCSWELAEQVHNETEIQMHRLPRKDIARKSLESSLILVVSEEEQVIDLVNLYAPEHLIISTENYRDLAGNIRNAGSVFLGPDTPESAGDYASGTNHTLPTSGYARAYSGLSLDSFMKSITFQEITPDGLGSIGPAIVELARAEGLEGHAAAVLIRQKTQYPTPNTQHPQHTTHNPIPNTPYPKKSYAFQSSNSGLQSPVSRLSSYVRKNILELAPYSSARDEFSGVEGIFLDANENPNDTGLNRYPDPHQRKLKTRVAALKGVDPGQLFLGNGSDEAIDLLIRIFCEPGSSRILTMSPTYGMYKVCAGVQDVAVDTVLLNDDFSLDCGRMLSAVRFNTKLIFLCSPNNPTGNQIPLQDVLYLSERFNGVIVLDEAYIDFASGPSALSVLKSLPNLVVLQTFSKAWGMAGVRLGMAFADPFIISLMDKVKYPYNLSILAQETVLKRVEEVYNVEESGAKPRTRSTGIEEIQLERWKLEQRLSVLPCVEKVFPSEANFLLVRVADARALYEYLLKKGIVVRDRSSQPLCHNCLRITVGTPDENQKLIQALEYQINK